VLFDDKLYTSERPPRTSSCRRKTETSRARSTASSRLRSMLTSGFVRTGASTLQGTTPRRRSAWIVTATAPSRSNGRWLSYVAAGSGTLYVIDNANWHIADQQTLPRVRNSEAAASAPDTVSASDTDNCWCAVSNLVSMSCKTRPKRGVDVRLGAW